MTLNIDQLQTGDLVREVSPESLQYFADMELSPQWSNKDLALNGKFVRLGEVVLVGSTMHYGKRDPFTSERPSLMHMDMVEYALNGMEDEVVDRIVATAPRNGDYLRKWPIVDAGATHIIVDEERTVTEFIMRARSFHFGRADVTGRQKSINIAQQAVGPDIQVVNLS